MNISKKQEHLPSQYLKERLRIIDMYVDETGDRLPDLHRVAAWAHSKGLFETPSRNAIKYIYEALANLPTAAEI